MLSTGWRAGVIMAVSVPEHIKLNNSTSNVCP